MSKITMYSVKEGQPTPRKLGILFDDYKRAEDYWLDEGKPGKIWSIVFRPDFESVELEREN